VAAAPPRRVIVVGGGAAGGLLALQLLVRARADTTVIVVEPRASIGAGIAYSATQPWHRINVPARTMSARPDDPDAFVRMAGVDGNAFAARGRWGRYLAGEIAWQEEASAGSLLHVRAMGERLVDRGADVAPAVRLEDGRTLEGDAMVLATGNALPRVPTWLAPIAADPRGVVDPWAPDALDAVDDGQRVLVIGTGHTAADVIETVLRVRPASQVVAVSRHGDLPRAHLDPPRVRPLTPVFDVEAFLAFADPLLDARAAIEAHPEGWRQGLDSLRPIHRALWLAMSDDTRRAFLAMRREWEVHRSRLPAEVERELAGWAGEGRLEIRALEVVDAAAAPDGITLAGADGASIRADHVVLAAGPDEAPGATPLLRAGIDDGLLRPGPYDLGIDADAATLRVRDSAGAVDRPLFAIGPILRGVLWETIAVPEIRVQAATLAERLLG
jgi:uncharacterized NAD(P)/FAD-binding protein YdhS